MPRDWIPQGWPSPKLTWPSQRALGIKKSPQSFSLKSVLVGGDLAEAQQSPRRHNHGHQ